MKIFVFFFFIFIYSCSDKTRTDIKTTNYFYEKAWVFFEQKNDLKAFGYFNKAKESFLKQKDSLGAGKCLMNMGIILTGKGDYFGAQEISLEAKKFFNENNKNNYPYISTNYNNLGITSYNLKDYKNAIKFYDLAIKFSYNLKDKNAYINNKALTYRDIKEYKKCISLYKVLSLKSNEKEIEGKVATINNNLAYTKWLQNPNYNPIPEFQKALNIRLKEKDNWGLNSSYAHLADYYTENQKDSALLYANKMYNAAKEIKSPDDQIEALQKLISLENPKKFKQYFKIYQKLNDSLQTERNKAKNQFALIRYETEKNKADFLKAKAESRERQNKIIVRNIIVIALIIFLIFGYLYYTKRQNRLQQEKLLEIKNTELKYSKKVHDRVANRIYQIMSQVENSEAIDRNALLFGLENVYETSRDISYENKEINENQNFSEQISNMLGSYSSDAVKIIFNGNNEKLWEGINFQIKTDAYLILQELMTNMKKHSKADKVFIKFLKEKNHINISYTDNGIGIKGKLPKNGLQNMENRILSINGKINFDTETNNLLKINFTFPI